MSAQHFSEMIVRAFMGLGGLKLLKVHKVPNGCIVIVRHLADGQEYIATFYPIRSEKIVLPDTVDQFLDMTKKDDDL